MKKNAIICLALVLMNGYALASYEAATVTLSYTSQNGVYSAKAKFAVSNTSRVYFSQGNLQYQASTNTWRLATHQYDYVGGIYQTTPSVLSVGNVYGSSNNNYSPTYSGWIDLFRFGTSGWNSGAKQYLPYATSLTNSHYMPGNSQYNGLVGNFANADWGVYNPIKNGGNESNVWRTLTFSEWYYLLKQRPNASEKRAIGNINGVSGLILLPDEWILPDGLSFNTGQDYSKDENVLNEYTLAEWAQMEAAGALFLPCAGLYETKNSGEKESNFIRNKGEYWSATTNDPKDKYSWYADKSYSLAVHFDYNAPTLHFFYGHRDRANRSSVRLVTTDPRTLVPHADIVPCDGGTIRVESDSGQHILTATAEPGYIFVNWEDGSINPTRVVDYGENTYSANFIADNHMIDIVAWTSDTVVIQSESDMSKCVVQWGVGSKPIFANAVLRKVDEGIYAIIIPNLLNLAGETLTFMIVDKNGDAMYKTLVNIPNIIVGDQSFSGVLPNMDIWVTPNARLTMDLETFTANNVYIYGGGKIIIPTNTTLELTSISMRGGARNTNHLYRFSNPQLYVDGTLINHNNDTIYYDYLLGDQQWYALGLPATAQVGDIRYLSGQTAEGQFAIETYNGQTRSTRSYIHAAAWENMTGTELKAGIGYNIFAHPETVTVGTQALQRQYSRLRIPMYMPMPKGEPQAATIAVTAFGNDNPQAIPEDRGWNFIANPYLSNYNGWLTQDYIPVNYVTIPSNNGQSYTQEYIEDVSIASFHNCFVQVEEDKLLTFHREARSRKAARTTNADEQRLRLILGDANAQDKVGIRLSNHYTHQYEINADLLKFDHTDLSAYVVADQHLAFAALPMDNKEIALGYSASRAGHYTWALSDKDLTTAFKHIYLYDRETNQTVDLLQEDYAFSTEAMTNDQRFVVRAVATTTTTTTTTTTVTTTEWDCLDFANLYSDHVVCKSGDAVYDGNDLAVGVVNKGWKNANSRHTVVDDTTATDPRTGNQLRLVPYGATKSVRLGNWQPGAEIEKITYNYTVDVSQVSVLFIQYAVVLENPMHNESDNPRFSISVQDEEGFSILSCANFSYTGGYGETSTWNTYQYDTVNTVVWSDWESVGIDLTDYDGKTIYITFTTRDCLQSGHFGYAYFNIDCSPKTIEVAPCVDVANGVLLKAPNGFNYEWYKTDESTPIATTQSVTVFDPAYYRCKLSSTRHSECDLELVAHVDEYYPNAKFDIKVLNQEGKDYISVTNKSTITDVNNEELYGISNVWYEWDFDEDITSDDDEPEPVLYNESGMHTISLVMHMGSFCTDTMTRTICYGGCDYMRSDTICPGDSILFDGKYISQNGEYIATYTGQFGFDSIVHEYLYYWPTYGTTYGEMTTADVDAPAPVANTPATNWAEPFVPIIPDDYDTICSGETYTWHGKQFTQSGTYCDTLSTILHGCDSIVTLHLFVSAPQVTIPLKDTASCQLVPFLWRGHTIESDTICYDTIRTTRLGCDSIYASLRFSVSPAPVTLPQIDTIVCDTLMPYTWRGMVYTKPDTYRDTIPGSRGCDSIYRSFRLDTIHCVRPEPPVPPEPECGDSLVYRKWDDVLFCDDGLRQFIAYQWYRDDQLMSGETKQYLYLPGGQMGTASYGVVATRRNGTIYESCSKPFYDWPRSADTYVQVQTVVRRGGALRIDMSDPCAEVEIYSTLGQRVLSASIVGPQYSLPIHLPTGAYVLRLQGDRVSALTKILVE